MLLLLLLLISSRLMMALLSDSVLLRVPPSTEPRRQQAAGVRSVAAYDESLIWTGGVTAALELLKRSRKKWVIVNVRNGLGNRLRAFASAASVAAALGRPLMVVWVSDLHCNCSFRNLFKASLNISVLEEELPLANLTADRFQVYNYMRPEPGAVKDEPIEPDPQRHLYFKSAFLMSHPMGSWRTAQRQMGGLTPVAEVVAGLVADDTMVGLHVRTVFDAPRDDATARTALGEEAVRAAESEYGTEGARRLMQWRKASHWSNFVPRIAALLQEDARIQFYLAADSKDAYDGLSRRFPGRILLTERHCGSERCDFRDCEGMRYSLIDMINLARTRLILGSGWSSYSEVAAYWGGEGGKPVPMLLSGRDFGSLVNVPPVLAATSSKRPAPVSRKPRRKRRVG